MTTLICGPMYSGKSTALFQRLERCLYANKKVLLIRPKKDTRGYFSHSGGINPELLEEKFKDKFVILYYKEIDPSDCNAIVNDGFEAVFVDEYFMIKGSSNLTQLHNIDIYFGGLLASSECKLFDETIKILPYCDKIKKLNGVCIECGNELGNYSFAKFNKTTDVVVGDSEYECLCHDCYDKKQQEKILSNGKHFDKEFL